MHSELFLHLDHDHEEFAELLSKIRDALKERTSLDDVRAEIHETAILLRDAFITHFGEEEEAVFPLVVEALPAAAPDIARLIVGHDVLCGTALRMAALVDRHPTDLESEREHLRVLFERLERAYREHAQLERTTLRRLAEQLPPEAKKKLSELAHS